jgi:hypothetical protein
MMAGMVWAWTPGGEYAGGGMRTNAVNDPYAGNVLPQNQNVTVVGRVSSNDVAVFTDRTGRFVKATNLVGQVQAWALEATTGAVATANNAYTTATGAVALATLATTTATGAVGVAQAAQNTATGAVALATLATTTATGAVGISQAAWNVGTNGVSIGMAASNAAARANGILDTNRWIRIEDVAGASRIMVATNVLQTIDTNGVVDLWKTVESGPAWVREDTGQILPFTYPLQDYNADGWLIIFGVDYNLVQFSADNPYISVSGSLDNFYNTVVNLSGSTTFAISYRTYLATNHIVRLASTNDVAVHAALPTHLVEGDRALIDSIPGFTAAPVWNNLTNMSGAVTLTNALEAPIYLHATGSVSIAFAGLRPPLPVYLVVRSPASVSFPTNTYFVGGGSFQTNRANHFIVWDYASELYVTPVTTTE